MPYFILLLPRAKYTVWDTRILCTGFSHLVYGIPVPSSPYHNLSLAFRSITTSWAQLNTLLLLENKIYYLRDNFVKVSRITLINPFLIIRQKNTNLIQSNRMANKFISVDNGLNPIAPIGLLVEHCK